MIITSILGLAVIAGLIALGLGFVSEEGVYDRSGRKDPLNVSWTGFYFLLGLLSLAASLIFIGSNQLHYDTGVGSTRDCVASSLSDKELSPSDVLMVCYDLRESFARDLIAENSKRIEDLKKEHNP